MCFTISIALCFLWSLCSTICYSLTTLIPGWSSMFFPLFLNFMFWICMMEQCNLNILCNTICCSSCMGCCCNLLLPGYGTQYCWIYWDHIKSSEGWWGEFFRSMNHHELFTFCKPILQSSQFSSFCKLIIVKAVLPLIFILCVNFNQQVWINLGPLLYHFADSYGPDYVIY